MDMRGLAVLSPAGLEAILSRLPAEERAGIRWAAGEIRSELHRLYEGELTPDLIAEVSAALLVKVRGLMESLEALTGDGTVLLAVDTDEQWGRELEALRAYVEPGAASAADWVWRAAVRPMVRWVVEMTDETRASELQAWYAWEVPPPSVVRDTPEAGVLRGEFLLLAAFEGTHAHLDVTRVTELAYLAFEHACEGVDALAARGVNLARYVVDTAEARVSRTIHHAEALRSTLTDEDMEALRGARLGSLR